MKKAECPNNHNIKSPWRYHSGKVATSAGYSPYYSIFEKKKISCPFIKEFPLKQYFQSKCLPELFHVYNCTIQNPLGINNFHLCVALWTRAGSVAGIGRCAEMCRAALDTIRIPVPCPCDFFIGSHLDLVGIKKKSFLSKNSLLLKESHSQTNPGADIYQNSFRPEGTISDAQERCQQRRRGQSPRLVSPLKSKDNKIPQGLKPYRSERNSKCKPFLCVYEYKLPG